MEEAVGEAGWTAQTPPKPLTTDSQPVVAEKAEPVGVVAVVAET